MVRSRRLELPRVAPLPPQGSASTVPPRPHSQEKAGRRRGLATQSPQDKPPDKRPGACYGNPMLHLIKLCVGVDTLEELAGWQKKRLAEKKRKGQKPELVHVTRQTPKRAE